ncbi:hypothetical protein ONZ45_g17865 [Pleurotus djamor]|nr:hypothetical protein ONZ45_g17865 [Pleurotus djamor]
MDELDALTKLIFDSVSVVKSSYAGARHPPPKQLKNAIKTIEAACAQLTATVANPGHVVKLYGSVEPACIGIVTEAKIADLLLDKPEGVHVDELGKLSDQNPGKLSRILRTLATNHIFLEGFAPNVFANNRLSMKLLSADPVSTFAVVMSDHTMKSCALLGDVFADPKKRKSERLEDTAFQLAHGVTFFEFLSDVNIFFCAPRIASSSHPSPQPKNTRYYERFNRAMVGWESVTGKEMLPRIYPWDQLPLGSTVVDVGGGNGHVVLPLLRTFPGLSIIVQDTPTVVSQGREYWDKEFPDAVKAQKVAFVSFDFLTESPVKEGVIRHVLHNWPDDQCVLILKNVRKAASVTSKLLIHEFVPQHIVRGGFAAENQAPAPLPPNWGAARNEHLRHSSSWGFQFVKVWDGGEASLIEFVPF